MSLRARQLGLGLAFVGVLSSIASLVAKPVQAQDLGTGSGCTYDERTGGFVTAAGTECLSVGGYSWGRHRGYVGTRGIVLRNNKPVWAEYAPDQTVPAGGVDANGDPLTFFVPGAATEIPNQTDVYDKAQVLDVGEVLFARQRFEALDAQYGQSSPKGYEMLTADQYASRTAQPKLSSRTTQVMVVPGKATILAEFSIDPLRAPQDTKPPSNPPFGGMKNFLVQTASGGNGPGTLLFSSKNVITYLADFFSQVPAGSATAWGDCRDMPTSPNSTDWDDLKRFEDCDAWRIGQLWGPIVGATVDSGSRWMIQDDHGVLTQQATTDLTLAGRYDLEYPYIADSQFWDTLTVSMTFAPFDARVPFGSRFMTQRRVQGGATLEVNPGAVSAFDTSFTGLGYGNVLGGQSPMVMADWDGGLVDTHKWRSVNVGIEVSYMRGSISMRNEVRPGIPLAPGLDGDIHIDDPGDDPKHPPTDIPPSDQTFVDGRTDYGHVHDKQPPRSLVSVKGEPFEQGAGGENGKGAKIDRLLVPDGAVAADATIAQGLSPDGTPSPVYDSDLLWDISRADFANTDVHVFGPAGDLITTRIGLRQTESPGLKCDLNKICTVSADNPSPVASTLLQDFIRNRYPGARYKVVVVNRSTGYVGTGYVQVGQNDGQVGALDGFQIKAADGGDIVLRPPNLTVEVTRLPSNGQPTGNDVCAQLQGIQPCEHIVGFEGGALTDDTQVVITTTWLDWDGSPLPSGLPGFTGRLSKIVAQGTLGGVNGTTSPDATSVVVDATQASAIGHFQIKPGRQTQVVRLADHAANHYYLHISGANGDRCGKASDDGQPVHDSWEWFSANSPACASFAQSIDAQFDASTDRRPDLYVPMLVPVFDAKGTADALQLKLDLAKKAATAPTGGGSPSQSNQRISVDPIYTSVYRAEQQFTVYDLPVFNAPQVVTEFDPTKQKSSTTLSFGYDLGDGGFDPLDPYGSAKDPTWSLGFEELKAMVDNANATASFDDLEKLLQLTPAEQLNELATLANTLSGDDYLALQLYLANDRGNPLYQDFDVPYLLEMKADPIVLTRRENFGSFATQATLPPYLEDYRAIPFAVLRDSNLTISAVSEGTTPITLVKSTPVGQGVHYFVLDGSQLTTLAVGSAFTLQFEATLANPLSDPGSQFPSHIVKIAVRRDVVRSNRPLGEIVEHDVNIIDGSLHLTREDFSLQGLGPDLSFQRTYSNLHGDTEFTRGQDGESLLGPGWSHNFNFELSGVVTGPVGPAAVPSWVSDLDGTIAEQAQIDPSPDTEFGAVSVNGATFLKVNGAWVGEQGRQAQLLQDEGCVQGGQEDCFKYVARDGTTYAYDYPGTTDATPGTPADPNSMVSVAGGLAERLGESHRLLPNNATPGTPATGPPVAAVNWIEDRFGNRQTFHYDTQGRPDTVSDRHRTCTLDYQPSPLQGCSESKSDVFDRLRSISCLQNVSEDIGLTVNFCYDDDGNLKSATRGKESETYTYEREGGLTAGNFNLKSVTNGVGATRTYNYVPGRGTISSGIDPAQHFQKEDMVESIEFPSTEGIDGTLHPVVHFGYNSSGDCSTEDCTPGNTRTVTDPRGRGLKKVYRLNQRGNAVRIDEPKGKYTEFVWSEDDPNAGCDSGAPPLGHALMKRTVFRGDKTIETRFGYDANGNITSECGPGGYTQTWDKFGLLASYTDFHGTKQTWEYDDKGFLTRHVYDVGHSGFTAEYTPDLDPDHLGRVLTETLNAADGDRVTHYTYDIYGNPASTKLESTSLHSVVISQCDARGRETQTTDRNGGTTTLHYDDNDHVENVELPTGVNKDGVDHIETQLVYTYDNAGNLRTETDRNGLLYSYTYTGQNQVRSVKRAKDLEGEVTRFLAYDELGNVTSEEDWARAPITHTYDDLGFREITTDRTGTNSMVAVHDLLGNVTSLTDFAGLQTTYTFDDLNRELTATPVCHDSQPDCVTRSTHYETAPNITGALYTMSVTDAGRTYYTGFDSRGLEVRRQDPIGGVYKSTYDELGQLRQTEDEAHFVTKFEYDGRGYMTTTTALGVNGGGTPIVTTVDPDNNGNSHVVTRSRKSGDATTQIVTTTSFDAWNRPASRTFSGVGVGTLSELFKYDGAGNVVQHTDTGGRPRTWTRDMRGQVRKYENAEHETRVYEQFDPNGNAQLVRDARGVETTLSYDPEERVKTVVEASNHPDQSRTMAITARDGLGNPKTINDFRHNDHTLEYTDRHRLRSETHPGKPPVVYDYTPSGQIDTITDARNFVRKFGYDGLDRVQDVRFPDAQTLESHTVYDAVGNVTTHENRRHSVSENVYDDFLRVHQVNRYLKSGSTSGNKTLVLTNDYDDLGNVTSTTDANGVVVAFGYNNRNQLAKTTYAALSGEDEDVRSEARDYYDSGALKTVTLPHEQDEDPFTTTYEYDNEDRLLSQLAAGERTSYAYDPNGNLKTLTKPEGQPDGKFAGKLRTFDYDPLNRLEYVTDEVGLKTKYDYDSASNLRHVYGPYLGDAWAAAPQVEYLYDPLIDRVTERDQFSTDGTSITNFDEYDADDNVTSLRDPLRRTFNYHYDHYNRLTHSDYQDDPSTPYYRPQSVDIDFNDDANVITTVEKKKAPGGDDVTDTTIDEHDLLFDRLIRSTQRGVAVAYDYYDNGNRRSVSTVLSATSYSYDTRNRLTQSVVNGAPTNYHYHQDGRLQSVDLGNSTTTTYDYWPTLRVKQIAHEFNSTTRQFNYDYDKNGNTVSAIDKTIDNGTGQVTGTDGTSFDQYDADDRLVTFRQNGNTTTYGYERYNRHTETVTGNKPAAKTYDYDPLSERIRSVTDTVANTVTTYNTDADGNVYARNTSGSPGEVATLAYNALNQLTQVTRGPPGPPQIVGNYDYDYAGRRVRQANTDRGTVNSTYDGIAVLEEALDTVPGETTHYHRDGNRVLARTAGNADEYFHQDSLGSTSNLSDALGTATGDYKYDPFGGIRSQPDPESGIGFTGQQHDASTGFDYFGARFYDPTLGRFLSEDTAPGSGAHPESLQKDLYADSNPARFTDPTGHDKQTAHFCPPGQDAIGGLCFDVPDAPPEPNHWTPIHPGREEGSQPTPAASPATTKTAPAKTPVAKPVKIPRPRNAEAHAVNHKVVDEDETRLHGHPTSRGTQATQEHESGVYRDMTQEVGDPSFYHGRVVTTTEVAKEVGGLMLSVPKGSIHGFFGVAELAITDLRLTAKFWYLGPLAPVAAGSVMSYGAVVGVKNAWTNRSKLWSEFISDPNNVGEFFGGFVDAGGLLAIASKFKYIGAVADVIGETNAAMHGAVSGGLSEVGAGLGRVGEAFSSFWNRARRAVGGVRSVTSGVVPPVVGAPTVVSGVSAAASPQFGVSFFDSQIAQVLDTPSATLGRAGKAHFFMPLEDAVGIKTAADAARETGMAPSVVRASQSGTAVHGLSFPTDGLPMRVPTPTDAGGWPHFLEGGRTAVRTSEDLDGGYILNKTREFVVPGGAPVPPGSVLFRMDPDGSWVPIRKF